ncbi:Hypothetical_protein [Hexamita inflata]|uniref:Hypothetical_protein n=1 Tax=Hexamita inflata TaxID=28002 RepID=A0AA86TEJ2_9EUKA|nr:Hypothetical protein HINF_LOCUS3138 [Hexamita inflata]CAI9915505.1 Hypothetical protein HINF_LOCUS3150 [Hexamita inflata]
MSGQVVIAKTNDQGYSKVYLPSFRNGDYMILQSIRSNLTAECTGSIIVDNYIQTNILSAYFSLQELCDQINKIQTKIQFSQVDEKYFKMKCVTDCSINMTGNYKIIFGFDKQYDLVKDQEVTLSQQNLAHVKYLKVQCDFINTSQFGSDTIDALMILDRSNNFQFQAQTIDVHHRLIKPQEFKFWVTDQDDNAFTLYQIYIQTQFFKFECNDTIHLKQQVFIQLKPKVNLVTQLSYLSVQQISGQLSPNNVLNPYNGKVSFKDTSGVQQEIDLYINFIEYRNKLIDQTFIDNFIKEFDVDMNSITVTQDNILYHYLKYGKFQNDFTYMLYMNNALVDILIFKDINLEDMNSSVFFWQRQNPNCYVTFRLEDNDGYQVDKYPNLILRLLVK